MPKSIHRSTLSLAGAGGLALIALLALQIGFQLSTSYLYLLLFVAGTIAFFMIGYQLISIMKEEEMEVTVTASKQGPAAKLRVPAALSPGDQVVLDWARERFESGSTLDAGSKLERLSAEGRNHPQVLQLRHQIYFAEQRWHAALEAAKAWAAWMPHEPAPWEAQAACLCAMRQFVQAAELLTPLAERRPTRSGLTYRLAQLCAEMGRLEQAQRWLFKSLDSGDKHQLVNHAMRDASLEPLIHFLGRRCMLESILANPSDSAGREALAFASRHGISAAKCDDKGSIHANMSGACQPGQFDAVVLFADAGADEEKLFKAAELALEQRRPYILIRENKPDTDPVAELLTFLEHHRVLCARVTGDSTARPAMAQFVKNTMESAFDYQLRSLLHGTVTHAALRF